MREQFSACRGRRARYSLANRLANGSIGSQPCNLTEDFPLSLRPDPTSTPEAVYDAAIFGAQDADPMGRQARFRHELLEFGQEVVAHVAILHAFACTSTPEIECTQTRERGGSTWA